MSSAAPTRRPLWLSLLLTHALVLLALIGWITLQTKPVAMHDLQLASGEKLKCVSYAPYHRPGQTPLDENARITRSQIVDDLGALAQVTDCVRLYSVNQGLDQVPGVARELGLGVLVGAWIGHDRERNAAELDHAIELANAHPDVVRALIVGNEVLLRRERTVDEMRALIDYAKARSAVPVTYADVWEFWVRHDTLAEAVDFVTVHILPFWEDEPVDIEHALKHVAAIHDEVSAHFAGKDILIGETGWPSAGRQREDSKPSRVNQARYIREFVHQAHDSGWDYNLIEAIDQPWKRQLEGTVGGYWGMLDADTLKPKFPLAGPVAERKDMLAPLAGAALGGVIALALALFTGRPGGGTLRMTALAAAGATGGLVAVLHWEHAMLAYRNTQEWLALGGVAILALITTVALACWKGERLPPAAHAWRVVVGRSGGKAVPAALGALRGLLLFAAAVGALLLFVDARYRDFPTLLYLAPAVIFGVIGWWSGRAGRAERVCAGIIIAAAVGRWLPEPANPQAIAWLLTGLTLALPAVLARTQEHEERQ